MREMTNPLPVLIVDMTGKSGATVLRGHSIVQNRDG